MQLRLRYDNADADASTDGLSANKYIISGTQSHVSRQAGVRHSAGKVACVYSRQSRAISRECSRERSHKLVAGADETVHTREHVRPGKSLEGVIGRRSNGQRRTRRITTAGI